MNKHRRDLLKEVVRFLECAKSVVIDVKEQEENAYDNLPESLQYSQKGCNMEENIDEMDDIIDRIGDIMSDINDMIL